ncbi:MAG: DoxX family membrane protein [Tannerellaceae bacterium]|jgi:thiosulfate dehydrogenase [quinone] large subunit|nr:DoxX family membrane protein [Tannerellaceae bacterium]
MNSYSNFQKSWLIALRLLIGWHFLYEGVVKVLNPKWTSLGYLMDSQGCLASAFHFLASDAAIVGVVDFLNEWGLILIGLSLIAGFLTRAGCIGGMMIMLLYFLSHPPFIGSENLFMMPREGSYLWIDRNIIEIAALGVIYAFPTSKVFGLDGYFNLCRNKTPKSL